MRGEKCQIIQFTIATYNTNSPFEVQSKLIHNRDLCGTKQNLYNTCMGSKSWAIAIREIKKNKNESCIYTKCYNFFFLLLLF